jgi:pyridoxal phosphate enzyme (YggS family)
MRLRSTNETIADADLRLRANLESVRGRIDAARRRSRAAANAVTLVVVTKSAPASGFDMLSRLGATDVGENRVQSAIERRADAPPGLVWHGIGHLQTNKARRAAPVFVVFHALDSLHLAERLDAALEGASRRMPVYAQVNAASDVKKGGVPVDAAASFLDAVARLPRLALVGLMTMARESDDPEDARATFRTLREVRDEALARGAGGVPALGLSMGMSGDFEVAVEEGATVVRVGRAVWDGVFAATER